MKRERVELVLRINGWSNLIPNAYSKYLLQTNMTLTHTHKILITLYIQT
jgi:hypothetical protein